MNIAITGSTGLIGSALADFFQKEGHAVTRFAHSSSGKEGEGLVPWDAMSGKSISSEINGHDCVIHLAGANISSRRWTPDYKEEIYNSRIKGTQILSQSLTQLHEPPKILLSASAVGYYGNHAPEEELDESSPAGGDFLAGVCRDWENATAPVLNAGVRIVHLRFGVVLSRRGGALGKMLTPFKLGAGGRIGSGTQMMSWIALDEVPHIIKFIIGNGQIKGAVNCVSPEPVSNHEFTKALGRAIKRPTVLPMPSFAVKRIFGEMGEALLLGGQRVNPKKLTDSGYRFRYPSLEKALASALQN